MSRSTEAGARRARSRARAAVTTVAALAAAAAVAVPAQANLSAFSPELLVSGHPFSYTDPSGLSLELCINDPGCPASPPVLENQAPNDEAFYQLASATATDGAKSATIDFNVEAAFLAGPITFGRIQATFHGLEPDTEYTVTHPYGVSKFTTDANGELIGRNRAGQREEVGGAENDFATALNTTIGPFLRWTGNDAPAGYIGDAITPHTVVGSPTGTNSIRVEGPGLPPVVTDPATGTVSGGLSTDLFTVEGKIAGTPPPPSAFASLSTTSLSFPARRADEASVTRSVTLRNTGQVPLQVGSLSPSSGDFRASGCDAPVAPGGSCVVTVAFVATGVVGDRSETLTIASNAANNPTLRVALSASITGAATQVINAPVQRTVIIQQIPGVNVLGRRASSPAVSRVTVARRIAVKRLRAQGLRATMLLAPGTNVVRFAVYRARNGRKTGRAVLATVRTPSAAGLYRVTFRDRRLRALAPGSYVMEVRGGAGAGSLGPVQKAAFTVTR